jgi:hypothetical protein
MEIALRFLNRSESFSGQIVGKFSKILVASLTAAKLPAQPGNDMQPGRSALA